MQIRCYPEGGHRNQSGREFDDRSKSGDTPREGGVGHRPGPKRFRIWRESEIRWDPRGEGVGHRSEPMWFRIWRVIEIRSDPKGGRVPNHETKVVENLMERKVLKSKMFYGVGKCLKNAKKTKWAKIFKVLQANNLKPANGD